LIKIEDNIRISEYINKNKLENLFSEDMGRYMELYMFNKNEYICREEEILENMYFLVEGKAKVSKHLENGKSLLISFYSPITIIGDAEFVRNNPTDCSVQAIKDTYCIGIRFDIVRKILINDCKFLVNLCSYLSEKLTNSSTNTSINLLYPLENRLASYIIAFSEIENSNTRKIVFRENYIEIAELLGTSYRHLSRTLNKLCLEGILKRDNKEYFIQDYDKLLYLAGDLYK
jgi:cAMP-binding proteins - catabolite gene activator and regulatory subunit of cAMP-dependent protein kinases